MCESTAYLSKDGNEEVMMESVATVKPVEDGKYILRGILGERLEIEGRIEEIDLMNNRIVFKSQKV